MKHKYDIGSVGFAWEGRYVGVMGNQRIELLRALFRGEPLERGCKPVVADSMRVISRDDINWDTAGPRVTED